MLELEINDLLHKKEDIEAWAAMDRRTRRDRKRAKVREVKEELRRRMHDPIPNQGQWLRQVVTGFFAYHAVPTKGGFRFFIAARRPSRCLLCGRRGTACGILRIAYLHGVEDAVLQQAGPIISPSRNLPFFTRLHSAPWPSQLNNCGSPDIDSTQGVSATCVGTQKCD
jgi:hypothetical protein